MPASCLMSASGAGNAYVDSGVRRARAVSDSLIWMPLFPNLAPAKSPRQKPGTAASGYFFRPADPDNGIQALRTGARGTVVFACLHTQPPAGP